jgi:hypothetical protein
MMDEILQAEAVATHLSYAAADYGLGEGASGEARRARGKRECESGSQYVPCTKPVPEMEWYTWLSQSNKRRTFNQAELSKTPIIISNIFFSNIKRNRNVSEAKGSGHGVDGCRAGDSAPSSSPSPST